MNKLLLALAFLAFAPNANALTDAEPPPVTTRWKFYQFGGVHPAKIQGTIAAGKIAVGAQCADGLTPVIAIPRNRWMDGRRAMSAPEALRKQFDLDERRCKQAAPANWDGSCGFIPEGIVNAGALYCWSDDQIVATHGDVATLSLRVDIAIGKADAAQRTANEAKEDAAAATATAGQAGKDARNAKDGIATITVLQSAVAGVVNSHRGRIEKLESERAAPIFSFRLGGAFGVTGHFAQALGLTEFVFHTNSGGEVVIDVAGGLALGYDGRPGFAATLFAGYLFQVSKNWKFGPGAMVNANLGAKALQYRNFDAGIAAQAQYSVTDRLRIAIGGHFNPIARQASALDQWMPSGGIWVAIIGTVAKR